MKSSKLLENKSTIKADQIHSPPTVTGIKTVRNSRSKLTAHKRTGAMKTPNKVPVSGMVLLEKNEKPKALRSFDVKQTNYSPVSQAINVPRICDI